MKFNREEWLSLGSVAELLGVHPGTVRNWSDQGVLPVHRTQGGHRRYRRSEIELWMQAQRANGKMTTDVHIVIQNALRNTRFQISEGRLNEEDWYRKLDAEAREQYRRSGRTLLQGLMGYLSSDDESARAEAQAIGYEYASRARRYGLSIVEATHAFLFFRNLLLESMLKVYESAAVSSPYAWSEMMRKITAYTDQILATLLETFEAYGRNGHREPR
jgi:excisionase family DNA binding protein